MSPVRTLPNSAHVGLQIDEFQINSKMPAIGVMVDEVDLIIRRERSNSNEL